MSTMTRDPVKWVTDTASAFLQHNLDRSYITLDERFRDQVFRVGAAMHLPLFFEDDGVKRELPITDRVNALLRIRNLTDLQLEELAFEVVVNHLMNTAEHLLGHPQAKPGLALRILQTWVRLATSDYIPYSIRSHPEVDTVAREVVEGFAHTPFRRYQEAVDLMRRDPALFEVYTCLMRDRMMSGELLDPHRVGPEVLQTAQALQS